MKPFLLFDFDGTVANSIDQLFTLVNGLAPRFGYTPVSREKFDSLRDLPLPIACRALRVPYYKLGQAIPIVLREYRKIIPDLDLCPGMEELLRELRFQGITMALLSSNRPDNVQAFLDHHNLDCFSWVEGTGGILQKHSSILARIRRHGLRREQVLYVGDEARDIKAARRCRIKVLSVSWGLHSHNYLKSFNPDYLVRNPDEIPAVLDDFAKQTAV